MNKAHLIEVSIYFLKVLVGKKKCYIFYWKLHSLTSAAVCSDQLPGMKYDLMFSMHFQLSEFSGMSFLWQYVEELLACL